MIANTDTGTTVYAYTGVYSRITINEYVEFRNISDQSLFDEYPESKENQIKLKTNSNPIFKRFNRTGRRGRQDNR